jgi:hypothetical protein
MGMWGGGETPGEVERISGKKYPWPTIPDYNPDCQPSSGAIYIEALGERVVGVLQVKGLGVLVFTALPPDFTDTRGKVRFDGALSTFTKAEIGYSPNM